MPSTLKMHADRFVSRTRTKPNILNSNKMASSPCFKFMTLAAAQMCRTHSITLWHKTVTELDLKQGGAGQKIDKAKVPKACGKTMAELKKLEPGQRTTFFQHRSNTLIHSFFGLIADHKVSSCIIGKQELVSQYKSESKLHCVETEQDKDAKKEGIAQSMEKDFTWVNLHDFAQSLLTESVQEQTEELKTKARKKLFRRMDKCVEKLVCGQRENVLVVVTLTGRSELGDHKNGATFIKVT